MSVHTWRPDAESDQRRIVYIAGGSWPEREISREDAFHSGSYVGRHYSGEILDHVEIVEMGSRVLVIYYGRAWPDSDLVRSHHTSYGAVPFEVYAPIERRHDASVQIVFELDDTGTLRGISEHELGDRGELLSETRMTADGRTIGRLEYVYDENGDIALTREFGPDGELYDESYSEADL